MTDSGFFKDDREFVSFRPDRYGKATLFENEQVLWGYIAWNQVNRWKSMRTRFNAVSVSFWRVKGKLGLMISYRKVSTGWWSGSPLAKPTAF